MATSPTPTPNPSFGGSGECCAEDIGDGHLLDLFIKHKDESAFEELVRRHGRMVLGVCRRVLDSAHDAEDCLQAVFLVLVRKATTIQPRDMVGNWLYGVAYRTALEAKKMATRRRIRERKKFDMPRPDADADRWQELQPLLDAELSRLPERYRFVVIACDLEGRTRKEVARALRVPEGTVASRLARGRTLLAKRLTRHKLTISAGALAGLLADRARAIDVPPSLIASTTEAAAHVAAGKPAAAVVSGHVADLVNAVVKSMLLAKLKIVSAAVLAFFLLALGLGALFPTALAQRQPDGEKTVSEFKKKKPVVVLDCRIEKIDASKLTVQATRLDLESGADAIYELDVKASTTVIIDGEDAKHADLRIGAYVNIEFLRGADGSNNAVRIESAGAAFTGIVEAINEESVTIKPENEPKRSFDLDRSAKVILNGKKAKLSELKANMRVAVSVSAGKPVVVGIHSVGKKVAGVVKAVDAKTLSLGNEKLAVDPAAIVIIDGKHGTLADVRPGMAVTLLLSPETQRPCVVAILAAK